MYVPNVMDELELPAKFDWPEKTKKTLLEAARLKNDQAFIREIKKVHLGEKDFQRHPSCYNEYTKVITHASRSSDPKETSNYETAREVIIQAIVNENRCMSIDTHLEKSGIETKNKYFHRKLKSWVERNFVNNVIFLTPGDNEQQVIVRKKVWNDVTSGMKTIDSATHSSDESLLNQMVVGHTSKSKGLPWHPTVESLQKRLLEMCSLLVKFFQLLM